MHELLHSVDTKAVNSKKAKKRAVSFSVVSNIGLRGTKDILDRRKLPENREEKGFVIPPLSVSTEEFPGLTF